MQSTRACLDLSPHGLLPTVPGTDSEAPGSEAGCGPGLSLEGKCCWVLTRGPMPYTSLFSPWARGPPQGTEGNSESGEE